MLSNDSLILLHYSYGTYRVYFNGGNYYKSSSISIEYISRLCIVFSIPSASRGRKYTIFFDAVTPNDYKKLLLLFNGAISHS